MAKIPEDMSYKVIKKVGIISQIPTGGRIEANIIAWGGHKPAMDIREWNETGTRPRSGLALSETEMNKLISSYLRWRTSNNAIDASKTLYKAENYTVHEEIGILSGYDRGYRKELTISTPIGNPPRIELRRWKRDHRGIGRGIGFTLEQADEMIKLLIWYRDAEREVELRDFQVSKAESGERRRIRCLFRHREEIVVTAAIRNDGKKPKSLAFVESYAGYPNLEEFIPSNVREKVLKEAQRQLLMITEAPEPLIKTASEEMKAAKTFSERIKASVAASGIPGRAVARKANIGESTVASWCRYKHDKHVLTDGLRATSKVLGVNPLWLTAGTLPILASGKPEELPKNRSENQRKIPASKPYITPKMVAAPKPAIEKNADERTLEAINSCIISLAKNKASDAKDLHRFFARLRTEMEEKIFFDETPKIREDAGHLSEINSVILRLGDLKLESEVKDEIYVFLASRRLDIEFKLIG